MGSKAIVLLGLFLATVLLMISSEVAAARVIDPPLDTSKETNGVVEDAAANNIEPDHGSYGGKYGGRRGNYGGGHGKGGGYCRHGCCGKSYYKGGCRCCSFAGEKADAEP